MGLFTRGRGSVATGGNVVVTGNGNATAGAGASSNVFADGASSTVTSKGKTSRVQVGGTLVVSDGSVRVYIEIKNGRLFIDGQEIDAEQ